jgi:hypothetical protein
MNNKEKILKKANGFFNTKVEKGSLLIHHFTLFEFLTKVDEDLAELSHENYEEFKEIIPLITKIVIDDFKEYFYHETLYNDLAKKEKDFKSFVRNKNKTLNKEKRIINVHLTNSDCDLIFDSLNREYAKYINDQEYFTAENEAKNENSGKSGNEGCYIATMVYKDYNHPNVMKLRMFRDNSLRKSILGSNFIKIYYKYSPRMVEKLKENIFLNKLIKGMLDKIVKRMK